MTRSPDPDHSRVVLIGTHSCADTTLAAVPAIRNNLKGLRNALCDPEVGFFRDEHCATFEQPRRADGLDEQVAAAGKQAGDTFLVYYGGHAVLDDQDADSLLLTLADSDQDSLPYSFLRINDLRRAIRDSRADVRILILDCCYSGAAHASVLGPDDESRVVAGHANVSGAYILTSSSANQRSLAPPGQTYTKFTGALIEVLRNGIPDRHEVIDLHRLYRELELALAGPFPKPTQLNSGSVADFALVRNRAVLPAGGSAGNTEAVYISLFDEVVRDDLALEARLDAIETIARRAVDDEAYRRTLRRITEAREVPALLRLNVAWRLHRLGERAAAVNGLEILTGSGGGEPALDRLHTLMMLDERGEQWPEELREGWKLTAEQLNRMTDEQLWGQLMAMTLRAVRMPVQAALSAVWELVPLGESGAANLILHGLLRSRTLNLEERSEVDAMLRALPMRD